MNTVTTARIVKVFIDGKHRKSFPLILEKYISKIPESLIEDMSASKRLKEIECAEVGFHVFPYLIKDFLIDLEKSEKYVAELVDGMQSIGTRFVNCRNFFDGRFEVCFENGVNIKCPEHLHKFSPKKLPTVNLNY